MPRQEWILRQSHARISLFILGDVTSIFGCYYRNPNESTWYSQYLGTYFHAHSVMYVSLKGHGIFQHELKIKFLRNGRKY